MGQGNTGQGNSGQQSRRDRNRTTKYNDFNSKVVYYNSVPNTEDRNKHVLEQLSQEPKEEKLKVGWLEIQVSSYRQGILNVIARTNAAISFNERHVYAANPNVKHDGKSLYEYFKALSQKRAPFIAEALNELHEMTDYQLGSYKDYITTPSSSYSMTSELSANNVSSADYKNGMLNAISRLNNFSKASHYVGNTIGNTISKGIDYFRTNPKNIESQASDISKENAIRRGKKIKQALEEVMAMPNLYDYTLQAYFDAFGNYIPGKSGGKITKKRAMKKNKTRKPKRLRKSRKSRRN